MLCRIDGSCLTKISEEKSRRSHPVAKLSLDLASISTSLISSSFQTLKINCLNLIFFFLSHFRIEIFFKYLTAFIVDRPLKEHMAFLILEELWRESNRWHDSTGSDSGIWWRSRTSCRKNKATSGLLNPPFLSSVYINDVINLFCSSSNQFLD